MGSCGNTQHLSSKERQSQDLVDQLNKKLIEKAEAETLYVEEQTVKLRSWWKEAAWYSTAVVLGLGLYTANVQNNRMLLELGRAANQIQQDRLGLDRSTFELQKEKMAKDLQKWGEFDTALSKLPGQIRAAVDNAVAAVRADYDKKLARSEEAKRLAEEKSKAKDGEIAALKSAQNSAQPTGKQQNKPSAKSAGSLSWWKRLYS